MDVMELRIGNWVQYRVFVTQIRQEEIALQSFVQELKPIPLTPERLAMADFEKHDNTYIKDDYILEEQPDGTFNFLVWENIEKEGIDSHTITRKNIQYVHQLQNLYYCLCGEE